MGENLFTLEGVSKEYNGREVLRIDSLDLEEGRLYAVVGPNGAGKSTLLKLLNLLEDPSAGKLCYQGRAIPGVSVRERLQLRRQMCMVLQTSYMFKSTVFDNVAYGLEIRKRPAREIAERVEESLHFVGMRELARRDATRLSGGETQRIALARALAIRPRVLLLDEPTANLDPASVALIEELVKKIRQVYGTTVIMVTHNLFQARRLADEVLFLHQGNLVEKAPAETFFSRPTRDLSRNFISGALVF